MSVGSSVQRPQRRGITNDTVDTKTLTAITSKKRLGLEKLTFFMRQIVKCSFAALNTAPINPLRQPMIMNSVSSQMEKLEASPLI